MNQDINKNYVQTFFLTILRFLDCAYSIDLHKSSLDSCYYLAALCQ